MITVVDGMMTPPSPKNVRIINHGIYECATLHCKQDLTDVIKVKNFETGQLSCIVNHRSS